MKKKSWFRWWTIPVALIVVVVASGFLLTFLATREADNEIRLAHEAGLPVTADDMLGDRVPPDQNAAGHYQFAMNAMKGVDRLNRQFLSDCLYRTPEEMKKVMGPSYKGGFDGAAIDKMLGEWKYVFLNFEDGAAKPHMNFERPWEEGINVLFPEFGSLKEICRAEDVAANRDAARGKVAEAIRRLSLIRAASRHMFEEPTLIAQIVGATLNTQADTAAVRLQIEYGAVPGMKEALDTFLAQPLTFPSSRNGLRGEVYFAVVGPDQIAADPKIFFGSGEDGGIRAEDRAIKVTYIRKKAQAVMLRRYREAYLALPKDPADTKGAQKVFRDLDRKFLEDVSLPGRFAGMMAPMISSYGQDANSMKWKRVLCQAAVSALFEKQMTRVLPTKLEKFVDPDSGKPVTIKPTATGFALYFYGADGVDNGGDRVHDRCLQIEGKMVRVSGQ